MTPALNSSFAALMPALPPPPVPFIPRGNPDATPLPARYVALPDGRAWISIGQNGSYHANALAARQVLEGMEARGAVRVTWPELPAPQPEALPC